jgi:predicted ATP-grasp superfamily ATP-dependent carboligase
MATKGKGTPPKRKASVSSGDYPLPPIFVASDRSLKQDWESVMGWVAACVLVIVLLPILGMVYLDVLQMKHEAKQQVEKVEKLRRQIENSERKKNRDKEPNNNSDNPPVDRLSR